ncbi:hypothetical protein ACO0SA_004230 [Hanseniaspora valbyensis]
MAQQYSNDQDSFMNDLIGNEIFKHCSKENMNLQQCISVNKIYGNELNHRCNKEQTAFNTCVKEIKSINNIMMNCQTYLQNYQLCIFAKQKELLENEDKDGKTNNTQIIASEVCFKELNQLRDCSMKQLK